MYGNISSNSLLIIVLGEGNGNPLQYSCLDNPVDRGAWWAAAHRVAQSWTRLKRLSNSNNNNNHCTICLEEKNIFFKIVRVLSDFFSLISASY